MHTKTVAALVLSASTLAVAEVAEKRDNYAGDQYYSSLMGELNSLYMDYLTAYSDMPTDYSQYYPNPTGNGNGNDNSASDNMPAMTSGPSMPSGLSYDVPPPSIESVLITAVPASYLSQMANPSARSSLINEIQHGNYPAWYENLPASVKNWISSHYATGTANGAFPTDGSSGSGSGSGQGSGMPGAAPPSGVVATGLMGAACVLAVAVML